jgi:hypothetical protein
MDTTLIYSLVRAIFLRLEEIGVAFKQELKDSHVERWLIPV